MVFRQIIKHQLTLWSTFFPSCLPISETALLVLEGPLSSSVCPLVKSSFGYEMDKEHRCNDTDSKFKSSGFKTEILLNYYKNHFLPPWGLIPSVFFNIFRGFICQSRVGLRNVILKFLLKLYLFILVTSSLFVSIISYFYVTVFRWKTLLQYRL